MPHFFLHLRDGRNVPDLDGQNYRDLAEALGAARQGALELMAAEVLTGCLSLEERIVLTNDDRKVVGVVRFRDLLKISGLEDSSPERISPAAAR